MGKEILLLCIAACALGVAFGRGLGSDRSRLLGSNQCSWGPSFWCSNITNAKSCHAVQHCIQTVWEHKHLPPDHDSVCKICLDMVAQARQQLESNETQDELKQVFEGSCKLMVLKPVVKECCHLADEFIPELIETLASEMDPQVVCSVAGLCNNAHVDKLLEEEKVKEAAAELAVRAPDCAGCHSVVTDLEHKFERLSRDDVLQGILRMCSHMGSFSDACTNIIITYFSEIYTHLQHNLNPDEVCLMAGVCSAQFHTHHIQVTPLAELGRVPVPGHEGDDLPCELCEQLVQHLRDLLIANTTKDEFQLVLQGLCKQTKSFQEECMSLVDQYYPEVYDFLVNDLSPNTVCVMMGICKEGSEHLLYAPTAPLLQPAVAEQYTKNRELYQQKPEQQQQQQQQQQQEVHIVELGDGNVHVDKPELVQLPIERLTPVSLTLAANTQLCTFCEYFLHFVQQQITEPINEEKIKHVVDGVCVRLPSTIAHQCTEFIETYGDAFIALLAQQIDPSQVCPLLSLCPAAGLRDVEVLMQSKPRDKPNCPLCLFAVTQLEEMIKERRTEESIRTALKSLCSHLPHNLAPECVDFVETYANELIEMMVADLSPQEVCVYLKLCADDKTSHQARPLHTGIDHMTLTNEIPDNTVNGKELEVIPKNIVERTPQCVICEFVMSKIEEELQDKHNEDEIKRVVHDVCNRLPKTVANDCNDFVNKYADLVIQLLVQTMEPTEICSMMGLCTSGEVRALHAEVQDCAVCESTMSAIEHLIVNPNVDHSIEHVLKKACVALPSIYHTKCKAMVDTYGDSLFALAAKLDGSEVCARVGLCPARASRPVRDTSNKQTLVGGDPCTWGPSYWCSSQANAEKCSTVKLCQEQHWKGSTPPN